MATPADAAPADFAVTTEGGVGATGAGEHPHGAGGATEGTGGDRDPAVGQDRDVVERLGRNGDLHRRSEGPPPAGTKRNALCAMPWMPSEPDEVTTTRPSGSVAAEVGRSKPSPSCSVAADHVPSGAMVRVCTPCG